MKTNRKLTAAPDYGYGRRSLYFIENRGQVDNRVQYYAKGGGQTTFFTHDEVVLCLRPSGKNPPLAPL